MKIAINHGDEYNSYRERFMRMYAPRDVKAKQKVVLMLQVSVGLFFSCLVVCNNNHQANACVIDD